MNLDYNVKKTETSGRQAKIDLLWHGYCSGEFEPVYTDTDYFGFKHVVCQKFAEIVATSVDGVGRILYNLSCNNCDFHDVLKIRPDLIFLSAKFKNAVDRAGWFDYNALSDGAKNNHTNDHINMVINRPDRISSGFRPSIPRDENRGEFYPDKQTRAKKP